MSLENKIVIIESKKQAIFSHINSLYDSSKKLTPSSTETRSIHEFLSKVSNLNKLYEQFNNLCDECNSLKIELEPTKYVPNYSDWLSFETLYSHIQHTKTVLESRSIEKTSVVAKDVQVSVKLPPIELPNFDGKQENWALFYESFKTNIHNNQQLKDSQRVQYLVGKLGGNALTVFAGIIPNEENYSSIWNSLVQKYQDKRSLGTFYLNSIFDMKVVGNNVTQLNNFIERFSSSICALKQLDIPDLTDFIFSYFALKKLDPQLVQTFEITVRDKDIPLCSDLIEFIRHHVKVIERTNLGSNTRTANHCTGTTSTQGSNSQSRARNNLATSSHTFSLINNGQSSHCILCNNSDHIHIYECPNFKNMSVKSRFEYIKDNRFCSNCLSSKHTNSHCNSHSRCRVCNQKHHSYLHFETNEINNKAYENRTPAGRLPAHASDAVISSQAHATTACASAPAPAPALHSNDFASSSVTLHSRAPRLYDNEIKSAVVLSTAQVYAYSSNGSRSIIRCLIDTASQNNIITSHCCKRLKLNVIPLPNSVIKTVGIISAPIIGYVSLTIQSRISNDKYTIKLLVVDKITEKLPTHYVDVSALEYLRNIPLADSSFHIPGDIDVILGAQLFPYLLLGGRVTPSFSDTPPALETVFGYIIMGQLPTVTTTPNVTWSFGPIINDDLNHILNEFPSQNIESPDDLKYERIHTLSISRDASNRHIAFKYPASLGNSRAIDKRKLLSLEHKMKLCNELRQSYNDVRTDTDVHDILHIGPNLQADLLTLHLNFHLHNIAVTADTLMYLRIFVSEENCKHRKFLYRFYEYDQLCMFQFYSVAFNPRGSPYPALFGDIHQLAAGTDNRFLSAISSAASSPKSHRAPIDDYLKLLDVKSHDTFYYNTAVETVVSNEGFAKLITLLIITFNYNFHQLKMKLPLISNFENCPSSTEEGDIPEIEKWYINNSQLFYYCLFRDGERLSNANVSYENSILSLPRRDHNIVNLIINNFHRLNCHTVLHLFMSFFRHRYRIILYKTMLAVLTQIECLMNSFCFLSNKFVPKSLIFVYFLTSNPLQFSLLYDLSSESVNLPDIKQMLDKLAQFYWKRRTKPDVFLLVLLVVLVHLDDTSSFSWSLAITSTS